MRQVAVVLAVRLQQVLDDQVVQVSIQRKLVLEFDNLETNAVQHQHCKVNVRVLFLTVEHDNGFGDVQLGLEDFAFELLLNQIRVCAKELLIFRAKEVKELTLRPQAR